MEKLEARGYEVLLLNEPLDEVLIQNLRRWKSVALWLFSERLYSILCRKLPFQDVAKAGLKFGDEGEFIVHMNV